RHSARRGARGRVGRHGGGSRGPRLDVRVRARLARGRPAPARRGVGGRGVAALVRVVVVSGIWPPDPGGPASHAPALADFLVERGHDLEVVTTASQARAALLVRSAARRSDVVYATSMIRRSAIGARLARRPLVVKLVSDEVFERAARGGRYAGTLDEFQRLPGDLRTRFLRTTRNAAVRSARHVFCPSAYLRDVALRW